MKRSRLQTPGIRVWASHRSAEQGNAVTRASVDKAIAATGATAVIVSRLINHDVSADEIEARTGHRTRRKHETALDFFRYDYDEYEEPACIVVKSTVSLSTDFYDTQTGRLLLQHRHDNL